MFLGDIYVTGNEKNGNIEGDPELISIKILHKHSSYRLSTLFRDDICASCNLVYAIVETDNTW